jgi:hypothetical protein
MLHSSLIRARASTRWETLSVDLTIWAAVAEIVAAAAVIISLWYLAIQVRQSAELTRVSLEVELSMNWALMHDNMIQNPDLSEAYNLAAENWDQLTEAQVRSYLWFMAKGFHVLEGMYYQMKRGLLKRTVWEQYEGFMVGALRIEGVRAWWTSDGCLISQEFADYVDNIGAADGMRWRQVSTDEMLAAE